MGKSNAPKAKAYDPCKGRPYNRYNIYFILERERFLQSFSGYKSERSRNEGKSDPRHRDIVTGYEGLQQDLPPLAPRYEKLELPHDWYMPGKRKVVKRDHKKSHGVATFQEIAKFVADGWKTIDDETLKYCTEVARVLKRRHGELKEMGGLKHYAEERLAQRPRAVPTSMTSPRGALNPKPAAALALEVVDLTALPLPTAASDPKPAAAAAAIPTMEDFAWDAPPLPKAASEPDPATAAPMPKMVDFEVLSARPVVDLAETAPPFATSPDSYSAGQQALLSSMAKNFLGGVVAREDSPGSVAALAEGVPALPRGLSDDSLSDSTQLEADIPDRDIMALWYMKGWQ